MKFTYLKDEKNEADIELDNPTVAEILRVYLAKDENVTFVAWKREHPTKNPTIKIKTSGKTVKKVLQDAVESLEKDLDKIQSEFKKAAK